MSTADGGDRPVRLVVVGGGITGLAAAWEAGAAAATDVTVVESSDRFGGKIRTSPLELGDGTTMRVDEGADAFLARVPEAVQLCRELGLDDELTHPAIGRAKVWAGDQLRNLPADTVLGVPLDPDELAVTGILSPTGLAAVRAEATTPAEAPDEDLTIGGFLSGRFGRELVDRLVAPLIGGINAGDVDELSLRAVTPQLADAADDGGVLSAALRRRRDTAAGTDSPVFAALLGGTGRLVDELVDQLSGRGVHLVTDSTVDTIHPLDDGSFELTVAGAAGTESLHADAVVLATPAPRAAKLLCDLDATVSAELERITHSSPVLVTFVFDRQDVPEPLDASGFLVPRDAGLFLTAASYGSSKWAHWDDGRHVVLRVSAGHSGDDRAIHLPDDEVVALLRSDLELLMGITAAPLTSRVSRYPEGFAQYTVGHLDRVDRIEAALARDLPGLVVAGAAYRGVGIPACIRQGRAAAHTALAAARS